jgi:hypothetical protein
MLALKIEDFFLRTLLQALLKDNIAFFYLDHLILLHPTRPFYAIA